MDFKQMQTMDFSFMIIMLLLHFNPINLMLKYSIIRFKSFTSIIIQTKNEIHDATHERFSFKSEVIHTHITDNTNEINVRKYNDFINQLK